MNATFTDVSPHLLRAVVNHSLTPIYAAHALRDVTTGELTDFQIYFCNPAFCQRVQSSEANLQTQTLRTLFPTLGETGCFANYRQVVETGKPFEGEQEHVGANGHFWYQVSVDKLNDGIVVNFIDITDRKRVEAANRLLQTTLDASISSILAMTAIRNEQGRIVDFRMDKANRAVERSLFRGPESLEGHTLLEVFPGNIDSGFFDLYVKATDTGEAQQATYHYHDANGFTGWFEVSAVQQEQDKIVLTFMNVTEYKQNEQLIQQQANLVNSVLNATTNTVATYQAIRDETNRIVDFRFTLANQAALAVVNMIADELYAKTLLEVSPELGDSDVFSQYVALVETGQPVTIERYRQGRWFLANVVRFGEDGMLTSSIDITLAKHAQLQIEQLNEQLQRSNESLNQFASVASHDLQEPLRKIKFFGDMLASQYGTQLGDGLVMLQRMQAAADRMQTLIRDLLAYAQLSKGSGPAHRSVNLNDLVGDVLQDLEVAVAEKEAAIHVSDLPTLPGDALQLRQVFQNLLANALKFTNPDRAPRITLHYEQIGTHQVPAGLINPVGSPSAYYTISVADNGIGFSEKYCERIFGAFERLHGKSSTYGGSGIGLAIVRRVMDNHHGGVVAHSAAGEGATFTLYFPVGQ